MKKIDSSISVVVPVYNSEKTVSKLVEELLYVLGQFDDYEIILVDDGSLDNSWEKISGLAIINKSVIAIKLDRNYGQQSATLCGLSFARYEYTVIIDDDLEQDPSDIKRLYNKALEGYDVVYGIMPYLGPRGFGSVMRDLLFRVLTKLPKDIKVSSYRIMNRDIRHKVIRANTEFVYVSMEILKYTKNIANIDIKGYKKAETNYSFWKLIKLYFKIYTNYRKRIFKNTHGNSKGSYNLEKVIRGQI